MAEKLQHTHESELLPMRQRIAWMAAIWSMSVSAMVLVAFAVNALIR